MQCSIIQYPIYWENREKNLAYLDSVIEKNNIRNQLVVLPETFNTGFSMDVENIAEAKNGITVQWMKKQAKQYNNVLVGSLFVREGKKYFNRLFVVTPSSMFTYDKKHVFLLTEEDKKITAGDTSIIFSYKNFKIKPLICYDLRFPVWSRNRMVGKHTLEYDVLIFIANWPKRREKHWEKLLQARAIENQSYIIACNRTGKDGNGVEHSGFSCVIDPWGEWVVHSKKKREVLQAFLEKDVLTNNRKKFPFYLSADTFRLED